MVIHPTGECFDDVLDHQAALIHDARIQRQFIVHGICLIPEGPRKDEPFAHAWVEDDVTRTVHQSGILDGVKIWWEADRDEWYAALRVQERTRYTFAEAFQKNWETNYFGPWEEKYLVLCRNVA